MPRFTATCGKCKRVLSLSLFELLPSKPGMSRLTCLECGHANAPRAIVFLPAIGLGVFAALAGAQWLPATWPQWARVLGILTSFACVYYAVAAFCFRRFFECELLD